ncbi:hypothetical protein [Puniceibacterium sediminis]|uniref:PEP-CTERM protein-sorting domain-containing protein/MYXO-CTERM domain-containing protein n=1 Tax=Puniceibacterium sediminis TaxID=1608407 RepID=A0A238UZA1_9RHOB|nr:hypothetical protein [Puniceibacterium sediminis]SNR26599.1 PEP-CTERM protein-sorting domain-containing protein/MYXO-CTERM domain-containing protein [Puniceibacterium sediminis]
MSVFNAIIAAVMLALPMATQAATVSYGGTKVGDGAGINAYTGVSVASNHSSYAKDSTEISSDWVWIDDPFSVNTARYSFQFDLTGYDVTTASLSGMWGVDNYGAIYLNGSEIATLSKYNTSNFTTMTAYGTSMSSLFQGGVNTLTFALRDETRVNDGGRAAFRATASVIADVAPVPLSTSALFLLIGVAAAVVLRRRQRS